MSPTQPSVRTARSKAELMRRGGRRLSVNLPAEAVEHLRLVRERAGARDDSDAIRKALALAARVL